MKMALKLAKRGIYTTSPNPAVGCVLVRGGRIIGKGYHHKAGEPHAEIMALQEAGYDARGATAYVTLEPCAHYGRTPPCATRLCECGLKKVVIASGDPNPLVNGRGIDILKKAHIKVEEHVLEKQARYLNRAFFKAIATHMPYVAVKTGMSLDAKTALSDGRSKWITGAVARSAVQALRGRSDAIITGSGTVISDNPSLNVRYQELPEKVRCLLRPEELRQPLKVIVDSSARLNPHKYKVFREGKILWCTFTEDGSTKIREEQLNAHITRLYVPADGGHVSLQAVLRWLGERQLRRVLVEAGQSLTSAFIREQLTDELYVFIAPKLLGSCAREAFVLPENTDINACGFVLRKCKACGDDVMLHYLKKLSRYASG